jgi:hypothetical protein
MREGKSMTAVQPEQGIQGMSGCGVVLRVNTYTVTGLKCYQAC